MCPLSEAGFKLRRPGDDVVGAVYGSGKKLIVQCRGMEVTA